MALLAAEIAWSKMYFKYNITPPTKWFLWAYIWLGFNLSILIIVEH